MAKIYPDTNRFVDFYQAALDNIDLFDELQKHRDSLVLTEQTIAEFRRNRVSTLHWLIAQFKKTIDVGSPYTTSIIRTLPGYSDLTELLTAYRKKGDEVLEHLKQLIADEKKDPVAQKFLALAADAAVTKLKLTDQAIDRAHRRKLLGNPPCSPDKYSVGDEVIWELLLEHMKDDLIVVTKDHTYRDNLSLLREEYQQRTGKTLLLVTEEFSEALKAIGQVPTKELIEAEKKEQELPPFGWSNTFDAANVVQEIYRRQRNAAAAWMAAQNYPGFPPLLGPP
jgi:rRNA-processing protein FCF1